MASISGTTLNFSDGSTQDRPVTAIFNNIGSLSLANNTSYRNTSGRMMMFSCGFYHFWQQTSDDGQILISPDNVNWYIAARLSTVTCGQGGANTFSALVPNNWYVKWYHNRGWNQYVYYQY